jgi:hypothetical protein
MAPTKVVETEENFKTLVIKGFIHFKLSQSFQVFAKGVFATTKLEIGPSFPMR